MNVDGIFEIFIEIVENLRTKSRNSLESNELNARILQELHINPVYVQGYYWKCLKIDGRA